MMRISLGGPLEDLLILGAGTRPPSRGGRHPMAEVVLLQKDVGGPLKASHGVDQAVGYGEGFGLICPCIGEIVGADEGKCSQGQDRMVPRVRLPAREVSDPVGHPGEKLCRLIGVGHGGFPFLGPRPVSMASGKAGRAQRATECWGDRARRRGEADMAG